MRRPPNPRTPRRPLNKAGQSDKVPHAPWTGSPSGSPARFRHEARGIRGRRDEVPLKADASASESEDTVETNQQGWTVRQGPPRPLYGLPKGSPARFRHEARGIRGRRDGTPLRADASASESEDTKAPWRPLQRTGEPVRQGPPHPLYVLPDGSPARFRHEARGIRGRRDGTPLRADASASESEDTTGVSAAGWTVRQGPPHPLYGLPDGSPARFRHEARGIRGRRDGVPLKADASATESEDTKALPLTHRVTK